MLKTQCSILVCASAFVSLASVVTAQEGTKPIRTITGHTGWVASLAFHPTGKLLASGGHDGFVRLWDVTTGKEKWSFDYQSVVTSVAFTLDGNTLLCGGGGWVRQSDGKQKLREMQGEILLLATTTGKQTGALRGHRGSPSAMKFSRDGKTLYTCGWDSLAMIWDFAERKIVHTFPRHRMAIGDLALSPDEKLIAVTNGPNVKLYDTATHRVVKEFLVDDLGVGSLAWSPDGTTLVTGSSSKKDFGVIKMWDPKTGKMTASVKPSFRSSYNHLTFSPNGQILASTSATNSAVQFRSVKTAERTTRFLGHAGALTCVVFSPDGHTLASASLDKTIKLWKSPVK